MCHLLNVACESAIACECPVIFMALRDTDFCTVATPSFSSRTPTRGTVNLKSSFQQTRCNNSILRVPLPPISSILTLDRKRNLPPSLHHPTFPIRPPHLHNNLPSSINPPQPQLPHLALTSHIQHKINMPHHLPPTKDPHDQSRRRCFSHTPNAPAHSPGLDHFGEESEELCPQLRGPWRYVKGPGPALGLLGVSGDVDWFVALG